MDVDEGPVGISYSRLGPLDPRQVRYELAHEITTPPGQPGVTELGRDPAVRRRFRRARPLLAEPRAEGRV